MTDRQIIIFNFIAFTVLGFLLSAFQSSVLAQIFGGKGVPLLWVSVTVYFALKRTFTETLVWIYVISALNMSFSYSPTAFLLYSQILILFSVKFLRERIFWSGASYFMLVYSIAVTVFHLSYFMASAFIEDNSMGTPLWLAWLFQMLWVPIVSLPLFHFYERIDDWTKRPSHDSSMEIV